MIHNQETIRTGQPYQPRLPAAPKGTHPTDHRRPGIGNHLPHHDLLPALFLLVRTPQLTQHVENLKKRYEMGL